jgi:hypothetical protein
MTFKMTSILLSALLLGWAAVAHAHRAPAVLKGKFIDPGVYLHSDPDGTGEGFPRVLSAGTTLVFLEEESGTLYLLLIERPDVSPNEMILKYVDQRVRVRGHAYERDGIRGIAVMSIERLPK